jgi:hypothetical protein
VSLVPRPGRAVAALGALLGLAAGTGRAGEGLFSDDPFFGELPNLPQSKNGVIRPVQVPRLERVDRISEVFRALQACWKPPAGVATGQEITVQFAFKRNGEILGKPRITYYRQGSAPDRREAFAEAVRATFVECTPLPFTETFGAAIAGQIFTIRFMDAPST